MALTQKNASIAQQKFEALTKQHQADKEAWQSNVDKIRTELAADVLALQTQVDIDTANYEARITLLTSNERTLEYKIKELTEHAKHTKLEAEAAQKVHDELDEALAKLREQHVADMVYTISIGSWSQNP
jgi:hypothetical protein